jgi:hypothetical protein
MGRLEVDTDPLRQTITALFCGEMQTQNRILVVEVVHPKTIHVMEPQSSKCVEAADEISARVNLGGKLPEVNLRSQDWKKVAFGVRINVSTPEVESNDFGVVERRPIAEYRGKPVATVHQFFSLVHGKCVDRLTSILWNYSANKGGIIPSNPDLSQEVGWFIRVHVSRMSGPCSLGKPKAFSSKIPGMTERFGDGSFIGLS